VAFQQHLPGARERGHREPRGKIGGAGALGFARGGIGATSARGLHKRDRMNRIGEIGDDLTGLRAVAIERGKLGECRTCIALQHHLHQIEDAGAVGKAQQAAHSARLDLAPAEAIARSRWRAHRALTPPPRGRSTRERAARRAPLRRPRPWRDARLGSRSRCASGRSAGSATAP
jgi:hypothetical protein